MKIKRIKSKNDQQSQFAEAVDSIEAEVEFQKLMVVETLLQFMKRKGINKSELASRMGVGPSRVTAMLDGSSNLTIETLVRAGRAVGADLQQTFVNKGQLGHWNHSGKVYSNTSGNIAVDFVPQEIKKALSPALTNTELAEHDAEDAA